MGNINKELIIYSNLDIAHKRQYILTNFETLGILHHKYELEWQECTIFPSQHEKFRQKHHSKQIYFAPSESVAAMANLFCRNLLGRKIPRCHAHQVALDSGLCLGQNQEVRKG